MGLISRVSSRTYRDNIHKMMRIALVALAVFSSAVIGQEANAAKAVNDCPAGLYGENCAQVCAGCKDNAACASDGVCDACADGWKPNDKSMCEPVCFGKQGKSAGCDNEGECVAPDYCICGKSGAQVVGVANADGQVQCVSLRKDGIKGAFISLAVMFTSISFCGLVERQRNKGKK